MISEQARDPCADIDLVKMEEAGNQIMEHIVNVDLVNYQFDMQKMMEQANELGLDPTDFSDNSRKQFFKYAKCIDHKIKGGESPLVKLPWNLLPMCAACPGIPQLLDLCWLVCCPCFWCCYPFEKIGELIWNVTFMIMLWGFLQSYMLLLWGPM